MVFLALLALAALDAAGYSVIAPVGPEIGEATGVGPGTVGLLVACFGLGQIAGYPIAGRLLGASQAAVVLAVSLALVAVGDLGFVLGESLGIYFPARICQGIGAGGLWMGVVFGVLERFPGQEYRRLTGVLAAYSVGGIAGAGIGAVGGIRAPFALHLALVAAAALAVLALGRPAERAVFGSDRAALRGRGFLLASAGILLIAIGYGTLEGPLPLHFGELLSQAEIAGLLIGASLVVGVAAAAAGRVSAGVALAIGVVTIPVGLGLAGASGSAMMWVVAAALAGVGFGFGEAGALGILLAEVGKERIVVAMVVWSQVWAVGYLVGPALAGGVAEWLGYGAIVLVPAAASALVLAAARGAQTSSS